jgi:hypothetical protein
MPPDSATLDRWQTAIETMLRGPTEDNSEALLDVSKEIRQAYLEAMARETRGPAMESRSPAPELHIGHRMIVDPEKDSPRFHPRRGCLDCNVWLDPVRLA